MPLAMYVENNTLVDLPVGIAPLFFAKVTLVPTTITYCAVLAPETMQHPEPNGDAAVPLVGATAAVFDENGTLSSIGPVLDGYKLVAGGGVAYLAGGKRIQWTTPDECGHNEFFDTRIPLKDVFIAL